MTRILLLFSLSIAICSHSFISLRSLDVNRLTGTIPPQLGNLTLLTQLYAQICIILLGNIDFIGSFDWCHSQSLGIITQSFIVTLSGTSTRISSLAPFRRSSANSLCSSNCTLRVAPFSMKYYLTLISCLQLISLPLREFSSNQLTGTIPPEFGKLTQLSYNLYAQARIVFPFDRIIYPSAMNSLTIAVHFHCFVVALSGTSTTISLMAPSRLSSATSLNCNGCTLRIASFS